MSDDKTNDDNRLRLLAEIRQGESEGAAMARLVANPHSRHSFIQHLSSAALFGDQRPQADEMVTEFEQRAVAVAAGDLEAVSTRLLAQAMTLDALFTDMTHRAIMNRAEYPEAFQRYMNLGLRAQAQSRATLEALMKMHQPREQVVRHVHVHEGAQAVVAEQFHHHAAGTGNERAEHQAHAKGSSIATLSCPDPLGNFVPVPRREGEGSLQNARRGKGKRRTSGQ